MKRLIDFFLSNFGVNNMQNFTNNTQATLTLSVAGHQGQWIVAPGQTVELPDGNITIEGSSGSGGGGPGEEE